MGGDFGLRTTVPASLKSLARSSDLHITLVGDRAAIDAELKRHRRADTSRLAILHADDVVADDDKPSQILRAKRRSSMAVALEALRDGRVSAVVSAGNTGALMALSCMIVERLPGLRRPAICAPIPSISGHTYLLDLGANVDSDPATLYQFATMGQALSRVVDYLDSPRIALLNIGEEMIKGTRCVQDAAALIAGDPQLNYVGFIEGNGLFSNRADVVVCDGFVGNIALKVCEGTASFIGRQLRDRFQRGLYGRLAGLTVAPLFNAFYKKIDPRRYNGAALLGLQGVVVKSHGGAGVMGFSEAIGHAASSVRRDLPAMIADQLADRINDNE